MQTKLNFSDEIWKDVNGFEGRFRVSTLGRVMSINGRFNGDKILNPAIGKEGYYTTKLRKSPISRVVRIHTLVAETFIEYSHTLENRCVNHKDGNKLNNNVGNLEWTDLKTNCLYSIEMGWVNKKGEKHFNHKLTEDCVIEIRQKYLSGNFSQQQIADEYNIGRRHVSDLVRKICWKHI